MCEVSNIVKQQRLFLPRSNHLNYIIQVCVRVRLSSVACNKAKVGAYATVSPFSGDLIGDSRMSKLLDKSFIHRSYPKLACGSIHVYLFLHHAAQNCSFWMMACTSKLVNLSFWTCILVGGWRRTEGKKRKGWQNIATCVCIYSVYLQTEI